MQWISHQHQCVSFRCQHPHIALDVWAGLGSDLKPGRLACFTCPPVCSYPARSPAGRAGILCVPNAIRSGRLCSAGALACLLCNRPLDILFPRPSARLPSSLSPDPFVRGVCPPSACKFKKDRCETQFSVGWMPFDPDFMHDSRPYPF